MQRDQRWPRFMRTLEVFTDEQQVQVNVLETERPVARRFFDWCAELIPGVVTGALDYEGRFRVSSNSFFQVNRFLHDQLVNAALDGLEGDTALDLYAGVGLFSLPLARRFRRVMAVESGGGAVRDLQHNGERAGLTNLKCEQRTAEEFLTTLQKAPELVLLDPPRAGLGKVVVERLLALRPPRVADRRVRPLDAGPRSRAAAGGRLRDRSDDAGRPVSADVPPGDGGAAGARGSSAGSPRRKRDSAWRADSAPYSYRSATIGSTFVARRAGM